MRIPYLALALLLYPLHSSGQTAPAQPTKTAARPTPKAPNFVEWTEALGESTNISHDDYVSMGVGKLTREEFVKFLSWYFTQQLKARQESTEAIEATRVTYSCGRSGKDEAAGTKVHIYVKATNETPSEITSGVNQRLRSMADVEIVDTLSDADFVLNMLGFEDQTEQTNQPLGYAVSVTTEVPCKGTIGKQSFDFRMTGNHYLFSGPRNPEQMINKLVSSVDAADIESTRKEHATMKKIFNVNRKQAWHSTPS